MPTTSATPVRGSLQGLGKLLEVREVEVGVTVSAGIAPGAGVDADRTHERAQLQLALSGHGKPLIERGPASDGRTASV